MHAWRTSPASRFNPLADAAGSPRSGEDCTPCRFGSPCESRGFLVGAALAAGFRVICARGQVAWGAHQELAAEAAPTKESVNRRCRRTASSAPRRHGAASRSWSPVRQGGGCAAAAGRRSDRKSAVSGKGVSVSVDLGGRRLIKKKNNQ